MQNKRPAVDLAIFSQIDGEMHLLVGKRKRAPFKGQYCLPGKLLKREEKAESAVFNMLSDLFGYMPSKGINIPLNARAYDPGEGKEEIITEPYLYWSANPHELRQSSLLFWIKLTDLKRLAFDHGAILCEALASFWPILPYKKAALSEMQIPILGLNQKTLVQEHFIFYAGSFNPWHEGHRHCVRECPDKERLIIVPDNNPQKSSRRKGCQWDYYLKQYQILQQDSVTEGVSLYPGFCGQVEPNPTSKWLATFSKKFSLMMGDDSFSSLPSWHHPEKFLIKCQQLYIIPRIGEWDHINVVKKWIEENFPKVRLIFLKEHEYQNVSSTKIREGQTKGDHND